MRTRYLLLALALTLIALPALALRGLLRGEFGGGSLVAAMTATPVQGATCYAPCAVHFDATATADSAYTREFHSLDYGWNFDDAGVGGTWPANGFAKNIDTQPIAGHLYQSPGTFNPVLTVVAPDGESDTATTSITVTAITAHTGEKYCISLSAVAPVAGVGGCPAGFTGIARNSTDFDAALTDNAQCNADAERNVCLFQNGETGWVQDATVTLVSAGTTPGIIGAFGPGDRPTVTSSVHSFSPNSYWTVYGFHVTQTDAETVRNFANVGTAGMVGFTLFNNVYTGSIGSLFTGTSSSTGQPPGGTNIAKADGLALFGNTVLKTVATTPSSTTLLSFGPVSRSMIIGNDADGQHIALGQYHVRHNGFERSVIAHNDFDEAQLTTGGNYNNLVQIRSDSTGTGTFEYVIAHNLMGTRHHFAINLCETNSCAPDYDSGVHRDGIIDGNVFYLTGTPERPPVNQSNVIVSEGASDITVRNNLVSYDGWTLTDFSHALVQVSAPNDYLSDALNVNSSDRWQLYNNTFYTNNTLSGSTTRWLSASGQGVNHELRGNLRYTPSFTGTWDDSIGTVTESDNVNAATDPFDAIGTDWWNQYKCTAVSCAELGYDFAGRTDAWLRRGGDRSCRVDPDAGWIDGDSVECSP